MPLTIKTAFTENALRAEFRNSPAKVLPLNTRLMGEFDPAALAEAVGQTVRPGQLLVGWMEGADRRGMVLNPNAGNDLTFLVPLTGGGR